MKNIFSIIICLYFTITVYAQKPTKQEARQLFDNALTALKNSDPTSFANLWHLSNDMLVKRQKPFIADDVQAHYEEMKVFLDTALALNLTIDEIEISKESYLDTIAKSSDFCYIKMWFKYNKHYLKGIGFNVIQIKDKWLVAFDPDYSVVTVPK
ncbi:MAG: hypothetical protein POELPBGB_02378 [Bacteroidia bacterium]|nr:hypothetical protein [Bacteroidia bacterium]